MSRWVPDPDSVSDQKNLKNPDGLGAVLASSSGPGLETRTGRSSKVQLYPFWIRLIPFFLSALMFLSAFFSVFSPLPLLFLRLTSGVRWFWLAIFCNSALVLLAAGSASLVLYLVFIVSVVLALGEGLSRGKSLERTGTLALSAILGAAIGGLFLHSAIHHLSPLVAIRQEVSGLVEVMTQTMAASPEEVRTSLVGDVPVDEWKDRLLSELPSAVSVFALLLVAINLIIIFRANPNGLRQRLRLDAGYLRHWKAPEFLVWPTILTGFLLLLDLGPGADFLTAVFKFLMAIYVLQGLSVLGFVFDAWKIRGFFRMIGVLVAVFLMMPLLLSMGFFDLWFDFRSKLRQS